jgi:hypothetical protein
VATEFSGLHSSHPLTNDKERFMVEGIIPLLILLADIWAIINIVQSNESAGKKALWVVLVLVLPLLGLAIWYFAGPKSSSG